MRRMRPPQRGQTGMFSFNDWRIGDDLSVKPSTAESEQLAAEGKLVTAPAIGEKSVVVDAMEAVGQSCAGESAG